MTIKLLLGDDIRSHVLKILSGECVFLRRPQRPELYILSPWISDVVIDFSDRYVSREIEKYETGEKIDSFLLLDYNIKSINLSYALLLFKLHSACAEYQHAPEINIVTLPPDEKNYSRDYLPKVKNLLSFLDEIGCNVFLNSNLHSKLLLANDLALLGSFNLSSSALLYNREEIGVGINDLDNLEKLEAYCLKVMHGSERFGCNSLLKYGKRWEKSEIEIDLAFSELLARASSPENERRIKELRDQSTDLHKKKQVSPSEIGITRGWLLDLMIEKVYTGGYGEFLFITGGYDKFVTSYARDLNLFYLLSIGKLVASPEGRQFVADNFEYFGDDSQDSIMKFLSSKFARRTVPFIRLKMKSLEERASETS